MWSRDIEMRLHCMMTCYTISLSSLCKFIWRHWIYRMHVRCILSSVLVKLSIFSQLSIIQYLGLCDFSLPVTLVMSEIIYIYILCLIFIIESEEWTITHCLGLDHETIVCLSIFWYSNGTLYCAIRQIDSTYSWTKETVAYFVCLVWYKKVSLKNIIYHLMFTNVHYLFAMMSFHISQDLL